MKIRLILYLILFSHIFNVHSSVSELPDDVTADSSLKPLILPMRSLYHISSSTLFEYINNADLPEEQPKIIYLSKGQYTLESLNKLIDNEQFIKQVDENSYLLYTPIYIAHNAALSINNIQLKLDTRRAPFIIYNGMLNIHKSVVTSWDEVNNNYGPRPAFTDEELLVFGKQSARPYLLGLHGSNTLIKYSEIIGLGYQGLLSPFGISFNGKPKTSVDPLSFDALLNELAPPKGELIGNVLEYNFMGVYSNFSKDLIVKGNIIRFSTLYNVDPHDASSQLRFDSNIVYGAFHSHGIIFSREVNLSEIQNNIVFNNAGSGIMLDRSSSHNNIKNNIVFLNEKSGISIYESDNNVISENNVFLNQENGVIARNSQSIQLKNNTLYANHGNGVEVLSRSLTDHTHRDFELDPYSEKSSVKILENRIFDNHLAAINAKEKFNISLFKNNVTGSAPFIYGGELSQFADEIISKQDVVPFLHCTLGEQQCGK